MIIPDINLLVYAYNADAPHHKTARLWLEDLLSGDGEVGLPWMVCCGFVRLMTHTAVLLKPLEPRVAVAHVGSWLEQPGVAIAEPGSRHLTILEELLGVEGVGGSLVTDAHIAAIAIESQAELHSNDNDFARFAGLRWHNPLA